MTLESLCLGRPLEPNEELSFPEGAHRNIDYRSLIHERISRSYEFGKRWKPNFDYDLFFAATDTLHDVGEILWLAENKPWPKGELEGKLRMYGALQALAVEQAAVRQLRRCFGLKNRAQIEAELQEINEIRIAAAGHPSNHNKRDLKIRGCTFLGSWPKDGPGNFRISSYADFQRLVQRKFNVPELVERQTLAKNQYLAEVWNLIKNDTSYDRPKVE